MKGWGASRAAGVLDKAEFAKKTDNGINEMWKHVDGSVVKIHKYGNQKICCYKSGNNAHLHKVDPTGNALNDHGAVTTDPNQSHIGIRNPIDLPSVRGRKHGS
jgi:uncharacterized protein (DUF2147 family)